MARMWITMRTSSFRNSTGDFGNITLVELVIHAQMHAGAGYNEHGLPREAVKSGARKKNKQRDTTTITPTNARASPRVDKHGQIQRSNYKPIVTEACKLS